MNNTNNSTSNSSNNEPSFLTRFLWWCAGVDPDLLREHPCEWGKYASMGATILFTGIFAMVSMTYAMYAVFRSGDLTNQEIEWEVMPWALSVGLLWGMMIFNLDRYIITSFKKSTQAKWWKRIGEELWRAFPRILIAIVIAITISKPIELKLFENRIKVQISENYQKQLKDNIVKSENIFGVQKKETAVQRHDSIRQKYEQERYEDTPDIKNLETEKQELESQKEVADRAYTEANKQCNRIWNNLSNFQTHYNGRCDTLVKEEQYLKPNVTSTYQQYKDLRRRSKEKQGELAEQIRNKETAINAARKKHTDYCDEQIRRNDTLMAQASSDLAQAQNEANILTQQNEVIAKEGYSNNLVTQLEALYALRMVQIEEGDTNEIIAEKKHQASTFKWISLFITLLFLCVELSPILTKLISSRGIYDNLVDAETESVAQQLQYKLETSSKEVQNQSEASIVCNKQVMESLASAQAELLNTAIEEWRKEELEKIKKDPSQYIRGNTQKG